MTHNESTVSLSCSIQQTKEQLKVSNEARQEYLNSIRDEYRKASRAEKSVILRHAMLILGLTRKRIIRLLNARAGAACQRRGRKSRYVPELQEHL